MRLRNYGNVAHLIATMFSTFLFVVMVNPHQSFAQQGEDDSSSAAVRTFNELDKNMNGILEPVEWKTLRAMREWMLARGDVRLPEATLHAFAKLHQGFIRDLRQQQQRISNAQTTYLSQEGGEYVGSFQSKNATKTSRDQFLHKRVVVLGNDRGGWRDNYRDSVFSAGLVNPPGFKIVRAAGPDQHAKNWSQSEIARFKKLDGNHDGFVTAEELDDSRRLKHATFRKSRTSQPKKKASESKQLALKLPSSYRNRDGNNDGQIALYEWLGAAPVSDVEIFQQFLRVAAAHDGSFGANSQKATNNSARRNFSRPQLLKSDARLKPETSRKHLFRRYRKPIDPMAR